MNAIGHIVSRGVYSIGFSTGIIAVGVLIYGATGYLRPYIAIKPPESRYMAGYMWCTNLNKWTGNAPSNARDCESADDVRGTFRQFDAPGMTIRGDTQGRFEKAVTVRVEIPSEDGASSVELAAEKPLQSSTPKFDDGAWKLLMHQETRPVPAEKQLAEFQKQWALKNLQQPTVTLPKLDPGVQHAIDRLNGKWTVSTQVTKPSAPPKFKCVTPICEAITRSALEQSERATPKTLSKLDAKKR